MWSVKAEMGCFLSLFLLFCGGWGITYNQVYKLLNRQSSKGLFETSAVLVIIILRINRNLAQIIYFWASVLHKHLSELVFIMFQYVLVRVQHIWFR